MTTGALIAGRYRLEHRVGEGGMGAVWVAEDEKLHRWVAVKLLGDKYGASRGARERFEREAMALARLRSPYVVQVFDYGIDQAGPYIVMELLNGDDLYTWLKRNRPVSLAVVAHIVAQAARGLGAAHRAGIVHRDLKPANVFVVRDHEEQIIKLFDFGLAKGLSDLGPLRDETGEGVLLGTPRYMSPEQAHGARKVDHRSDLWSLGVIAYLAVTGTLPFRGQGLGEVITKIQTAPHQPPSHLVPGLPDDVDAFFARALAKDPDERFQSAHDFAHAFCALTPDAPISSELAPLDDGDTRPEPLAAAADERDDTGADVSRGESADDTDFSPELAPTEAPDEPSSTLAEVAPDATVDDQPESFELATTNVAPRSGRARGRRVYWLGGAAVAAVLAAIAWPRPLVEPQVAPPGPQPQAQRPSLGDPEQSTDRAAIEPVREDPPSEPQPIARPARPRPKTPEVLPPAAADDPPPAVEAPVPSAEPITERGLELFDDRH